MNKDFELIRGDTLTFAIEIETLTDDLNSCYFSCKKTLDDEEYAFQKSLENGITKESVGKYRIRIAPEDTRALDICPYLYDLQIGVGSDIFTIMTGNLEIKKEITKES